MTQRTMVSVASCTASTIAMNGARSFSSTRVTAMAKASVKVMSGSIAPSAMAFTGFNGTRSMNHCEIVGIVPGGAPAVLAVARSASTAAGSSVMRAISGAPTTMAITAAITVATTKNVMARPPSRPMVAGFGARLTPAMRLLITRGITVMRMAAIHMVPATSRKRAAGANGPAPPAMARPTAKPANRPIRTLTANGMARSYGSTGPPREGRAAALRGRCRQRLAGRDDVIAEQLQRHFARVRGDVWRIGRNEEGIACLDLERRPPGHVEPGRPLEDVDELLARMRMARRRAAHREFSQHGNAFVPRRCREGVRLQHRAFQRRLRRRRPLRTDGRAGETEGAEQGDGTNAHARLAEEEGVDPRAQTTRAQAETKS